jgi:hypothetical protein
VDVDHETLKVEIGEGDDLEVFHFKMPSPRDLMKINTRAETLRRRDDPESQPSEDFFTRYMYLGCALLEMLPFQADTQDDWPWSPSPTEKGKLVVDSSKFPPGTEFRIVEVYRGFNDALATFHANRSGRGKSASTEAVAG